MAAEANVIVTARQSYGNLEWYPGITPPNAEAIRQLYEDPICSPIVQVVDSRQIAASIEAGLIWWGFLIGLSTVVVIECVARWSRKV